MHITRSDCLALDETVFVNARVNRIAIGGFKITTAVFLDMPTCLPVALWLAALAFTRPGLRGLNRCCINDVYTPLRQNNVFGIKLVVDLSQ